jgi:hypothetical protein
MLALIAIALLSPRSRIEAMLDARAGNHAMCAVVAGSHEPPTA